MSSEPLTVAGGSMRLRRAIPAGVLDSGLAALATFGAGLFAARFLSAAELGLYALFFTAFFAVSKIPRELVLIPAEVRAMRSHEGAARLLVIPQSIKLAAGPAIGVSVLGAAIAAALASSASSDVVWALALTMTAGSALQPLQAHVRRMLHIGGASWLAAANSGVQLVALVATVALFAIVDVPVVWVPFGALAVAYAASISVGLLMVRRLRSPQPLDRFRFADIARSGAQLVVVEFIPAVTGFIVAALVFNLAGPEPLGYAEAARIVARPIGVIALGLSGPLGPRSVSAAIRRELPAARRISRVFISVLMVIAGAYFLYAGFDWPGNVLAELVPNAYVITGLVAAAIVSGLLQGINTPHRHELIGGQREASLIRIEAVGNLFRVGLGFMSPVLRSFAVPYGNIALATVRWIGQHRALRRLYATSNADSVRAAD